ncbi:MAG TPA: phosphoribosylamine--glycine ligase [Phycisphaerales bacterium]|nr:phosphoribosylamine--glycine ligase [Phycisphaerales bacterium]
MTAGDAPKINVLLIGGGGREHALAVKLAASPRLGDLWTTHPENPGLASLAKPVDVPVSIREIYRLQQFVAKHAIGLVVIGPEDPLAEGFADKLKAPGVHVFGPLKDAARLEWDKSWAKQIMRAASIPTAEAQTFTHAAHARAFLEARVRDEVLLNQLLGRPTDFGNQDEKRTYITKRISEVMTRITGIGATKGTGEGIAAIRARAVVSAALAAAETYRDPADRSKFIDNLRTSDPVVKVAYETELDGLPVIKAAGLAKGKGVILPKTLAEALETIDRIMVKREFGDAGQKVVIEERMEGREVSVLAIVDGKHILVLPPAQDHKRLADNDTGPNTGGMGAYSPTDSIDAPLMAKIEREVLVPTVDALRREGIEFTGVLYAGLMLTPAGPKVLEFNTRFGDPECQVLMSRLKSDLLELLLAACEQRLDTVDVEWDPGAACCVVIASGGYPEKPRTGIPITGIEAADAMPGVQVYHAGTRRGPDGVVQTAGGRVLGVTGVGKDLAEARDRAYAAVKVIHFAGMQVRSDIGTK